MDLEIIILSQKEKDKYHMISFICGIENITQMNSSTKQRQTHRLREQTDGRQEITGWRKDGVGVCDQQMQTVMERMGKSQGPTI